MIKAPRARFSLALLCLARLAPSWAEDGPVAQRPVFQPGDSVTYAERFETVACRTWQVQEVDSAGNMLSSHCGDITAHFTPEGGITRIVDGTGKTLVAFKPESTPIPFPLSVGMRWTHHFEVSTASQLVTPDIDERCEVTAIEPAALGAASVTAFHIECTDRWSAAFLSGSNKSSLWYAPEARSVVKAVNPSAPEWSLQMTGYSFSHP